MTLRAKVSLRVYLTLRAKMFSCILDPSPLDIHVKMIETDK